MRTEMRALRAALQWINGAWLVGLWLLAGCSAPDATCGPGTALKGGACVAAAESLKCGPGTTLQGTVCVPTGADAGSDGAAAADGTAPGDTGDPGDASSGPAGCSPPCAADQVCHQGLCIAKGAPDGWNCLDSEFADGSVCHCGCGLLDPDCASAQAPVVGCLGAKTCNANGTCPVCKPDCAGKECGDNGCGGTCGTCLNPIFPVCTAGQCGACIASCNGKQCGDNGCGGSCGQCPSDKLCALGACVAPPPEASCDGFCGGKAPAGCGCDPTCVKSGTCCVDFELCGCIPTCGSKVCGDDGCGGECGSCGLGQVCAEGACKFPVCGPLTCNGHGTCDPKTVTCICEGGYKGAYCDQCPAGQVGFPACAIPCASDAACDDGKPCTTDSCNANGSCVNLSIDATCSDGNVCTSGDHCLGGDCLPKLVLNCSDGNDCTDDACDAKSGCSNLPGTATACQDDKPCTSGDTCKAGTCTAGTLPTNCDDGNACTNDSCDPALGCINAGNGNPCTLPDKCSAGGSCDGSSCKSLGSKDCSDGNACTTDACDAATGACSHPPAAAGSACDDDAQCTAGDACDGKGGCTSGATLCALQVKTGLVAHYTAGSLASLAFGADKGLALWSDLSGNGRDLKALDSGKLPKVEPTVVLGRRGVRLDGAAGLATAPFATGAAASVFAVACVDAKAALGAVAGQGVGAAGWAIGGGAATTVQWTAAGEVVGKPQTVSGGHCYVLVGRTAAGARSLDVIEATTTSQAGAGGALAAATSALQVGPASGAAGVGAVVGEVLVYDRAVSDAERDSITVYLRSAWGFDPPKPDFAWYDAADLATLVTATGSAVTLWKDKSGLGRDAAVGADKAPVWHASATGNGKPALRFDGASVRLQTASVPSSPQMTVFAVYEMDTPAQWGSLFNQGHDQYFSLRKTETQTASLNWHIANNNDAPVLPIAMGNWQLVTAIQDATTSTAYLQAGQVQQAKQGPIAAGAGKLSLGNSLIGGQSMGGYLAEVRAYAQALGATDRAFVEAVLKGRFGL